MFRFLKAIISDSVKEVVLESIKMQTRENEMSGRKEILLTEYKEIITTLRNWDTVVYGMLTVIGALIAAMITYSVQSNTPITWGIIFSLFLFWLFTYIWVTKLAEIRIDVLVEIENELKMIGQYGRLRKIKRVKSFVIWFFLPYLSAFVIGPILGYTIAYPDRFFLAIKQIFLILQSWVS